MMQRRVPLSLPPLVLRLLLLRLTVDLLLMPPPTEARRNRGTARRVYMPHTALNPTITRGDDEGCMAEVAF